MPLNPSSAFSFAAGKTGPNIVRGSKDHTETMHKCTTLRSTSNSKSAGSLGVLTGPLVSAAASASGDR